MWIGKDKPHAPTGDRGRVKICGFKGKGSGEGGAVAAHPESMNLKQANAKTLGGVFHTDRKNSCQYVVFKLL
ncbi:MAG: hypothetical protein NPIRA03_25880 [Nitrospirales bacterium]|nr:MAG: hypothetical protein NPIRA03_25880 [Nitrospirales bacterium]